MKPKLLSILVAITAASAVVCLATVPRFSDSGISVVTETDAHLIIRAVIVATMLLGKLITSAICRQIMLVAAELLVVLALTVGWFWIRSYRLADDGAYDFPAARGETIQWYLEQGTGQLVFGRDDWLLVPHQWPRNNPVWSVWIWPVQMWQVPQLRGYRTPTRQIDFGAFEYREDVWRGSMVIGRQPPDSGWRIIIPHWMIVAPLLIWPALWSLGAIRRLRKHQAGHCAVCGYDLRATPNQCPECGTVASQVKS